MTKYSYSTTIGEKDAAAVGKSLPISTKQAIEICSFIRRKKLETAKTLLSEVLKEKAAVPFKRFTDGVGHRKGKMAAGRYPKKACGEILKLLNSAQANAQFKGLSSTDLVVGHISAQKAATAWHYGRRRRRAKRTSIEIVLSEKAVEKKEEEKKKTQKPVEKETKEKPKVEEKKEKAEEAKERIVEEKEKQTKKIEKETKEKVETTTKKQEKPEKTTTKEEKAAEPEKQTKTEEAKAEQ